MILQDSGCWELGWVLISLAGQNSKDREAIIRSSPRKMDDFESKVLNTIRKHSLLEEGERVVVAVSGGPDSVALLLALTGLADVLDLSVRAAHLNHQMRGHESDEDEDFVVELCGSLKIPLESRKLAVDWTHSSRNLENTARQQRYAFLAEEKGPTLIRCIAPAESILTLDQSARRSSAISWAIARSE